MIYNSGGIIIDLDKDDDYQCDVVIIMNNNINDFDKVVFIKYMNISKIQCYFMMKDVNNNEKDIFVINFGMCDNFKILYSDNYWRFECLSWK